MSASNYSFLKAGPDCSLALFIKKKNITIQRVLPLMVTCVGFGFTSGEMCLTLDSAQFVYKLGQICSERGASKLSAALCWRNTSAHLEVPHLAKRLPPAYRRLMSALLQGTQGIYSSQRKKQTRQSKMKQKSPQKYRVYFALASCSCAREWG